MINKDTQVVYTGQLHWIVFFWPVIAMCCMLFIGIRFTQLMKLFYISLPAFLAWMTVIAVKFNFSSVTIKKKQVILRTGLLVRQTIDIPMTKIETIDIRQSLLGSILHYGSLMITGTGGTQHRIDFLSRPLTCRRYIEQLMHYQT